MKHYYIRYPRNFANEYDLVWIESTDTAAIAKAIDEGYERITRKEAYNKVSIEKWRRGNDQAMSGYAPTVILPYHVDLPEIPDNDKWEIVFQREGKDEGYLYCSCWTHDNIFVTLYSDDGIVFYPVNKH